MYWSLTTRHVCVAPFQAEFERRRLARGATGRLYVAIRGQRTEGHAFIGEAVSRGAVCVVGEEDASLVDVPPDVPYVRVTSARRAASALSNRAYGFPSRHLTGGGVTGTNGKTTSVHWLTHVLRFAGMRVGMLSSVFNETGLRTVPAELTTPEAPKLHRALREMVDAGCTHAVIEVSSHGIVQQRTSDVDFDLAIFTNLTREHLDFHGSMENYAAAKARLFSGLSAENPGAILNRDDPYADVMVENCVAPIVTYGVRSGDVRGRGERDRGKQPEMGAIAASMADHVLITTDSSYSGDPERIANEILAGAQRVHRARCDVVLDRAQAIERAVIEANGEDVILITGRGHESFQVVGGLRLEQTDADMVREA